MSDPAALNALCQQGLTHHQSGRLTEAALAYEQVLAADPRHFDALQFLGVQRIQTGRAKASTRKGTGAKTSQPTTIAAQKNISSSVKRLFMRKTRAKIATIPV